MKTLIFLRHGETDYIGIFPDITKKGIESAEKTGLFIKDIIKRNNKAKVKIISSIQERAVGTAYVISGILDYRGKIQINGLLRSCDFYNKERSVAYWKSYSSQKDAENNYWSDPIFDNNDFVEGRTSIKKRFRTYLESVLTAQLFEDSSDEILIQVSHMEVLWVFARMFGFKENVSYCEPIVINVSLTACGLFSATVIFRNEQLHFNKMKADELIDKILN